MLLILVITLYLIISCLWYVCYCYVRNGIRRLFPLKEMKLEWMMQLLHFTTLLLEQLQHRKIFCPDYRLVLQFSLIESILMAIKFWCYILLIGLQFTLLTVSLGWRYDVCLGKISYTMFTSCCLQDGNDYTLHLEYDGNIKFSQASLNSEIETIMSLLL